jgi:hypothetical protein
MKHEFHEFTRIHLDETKALAPIAMEISRFIENKALAVAFLNRELGMYSGKQLLKLNLNTIRIITYIIHFFFIEKYAVLLEFFQNG